MNDIGLQTLLDLDGSILEMGQGYWVKINATKVEPDTNRPHGIRYSLSFHAPSGKRLLGYDNAHGVKPPKKFKYAGNRYPYDHKHAHAADKGQLYEFKDASQLMADFWDEVNNYLDKVKT